MATAQPAFDPLVDAVPARYVVGIDLGTTNSALSYVDTTERPWHVRTFSIPQVVALGQIESRDVLPSFHYQALDSEASSGGLRLPWSTSNPKYAVGVWARDDGGKSAARQVSSAKSWLCHTGVDRTADLLPWHAAEDVERLSPVEVSARYLLHLHEAWNAQFPSDPLSQQDLVLTLPASFDEVARELTIQAAARANLRRVVLIEEPQAAFYAWVYKHRDDWFSQVAAGQKILICDIGGGTTDFTLLRVRRSSAKSIHAGSAETVEFHRVAVGDHLILGGDNLDLALAQHIEQKLTNGRRLEPRQWDVLLRTSRRIKEVMLSDDGPATTTVHVPTSGAKLIGGALQTEVTRGEVRELLVGGFLPQVKLDDAPIRRQSGFQEFGLPYASDAAVTRYLAQFLRTHQSAGADVNDAPESQTARPDIVLFNGGFFASRILRERLLDVLTDWFRHGPQDSWKPVVLDNDRLDLAVANGAAYYGMVRKGEGVRIAANLARSYYIGVESEPPSAICLLPGDTAPGDHIDLSQHSFSLAISEPVEFPLYVSSVRLTDQPGALIPINLEQMRALPPIRTILRSQRRTERGRIPVELHAKLTEIGTIDLWCSEVGKERSWRLQFDIRSATQTDIAAQATIGELSGSIEEETWSRCEEALGSVFQADGTAAPENLIKRLCEVLDSPRTEWPPTLLRRIWEALMRLEGGRRRTPAHEARWLNLLGFALRPGYGLAVDDWRVSETWRTVRGKLAHSAPASRIESFILWRRIAGGFTPGQQRAIADPLLPTLREMYRRSKNGNRGGGKDASRGSSESNEIWCLLGSLELLPLSLKIEIGEMVVHLLSRRSADANRIPLVWTLGRVGQRVPTYGPLNTVVPARSAETWLANLLEMTGDGTLQLAVMQLARRTGDRYRDLDDGIRQSAVEWLSRENASLHLIELVRDGGALDQEEQGRIFGESLPKGLRLT